MKSNLNGSDEHGTNQRSGNGQHGEGAHQAIGKQRGHRVDVGLPRWGSCHGPGEGNAVEQRHNVGLRGSTPVRHHHPGFAVLRIA
ncbi:hypothetical protein D3C71_1613180 [compost metagenome]